ncbi:hypothetical protein D4R86_02645 [bacterium]|nr:MAG: hypothetical protein D4R86_02645 [bacterium]
MSFDLIPPTKQSKKKRSTIGALALKKAREPEKFVYIMVFMIVIVLVFGFYALVKNHQSSLRKKIDKLKEQANELKQERDTLRKEGQLADFQNKLTTLSSLVRQHTYWTGVFDFLEKATLPKVKFNSFSADLDGKSINMDGDTISFTRLAEQMIHFKDNALVEELKLSSLTISEEGIKFGFKIQLSPEAWQEVEQKNEP